MDLDTKTPPYSTGDKTSFAYISARDRWPVIITGAIDDTYKSLLQCEDSDKQSEGKRIVEALAVLKYELQHDRKLTPLPDDGGEDIASYNAELARLGPETRWFGSPWLYTECYLYRRIQTIFSLSKHWKGYDVFARQKLETFRSSRPAVLELAARYRELTMQLADAGGKEGGGELLVAHSEDAQRLLFREMCEVCLWGNATDLSLLTSLTYDDIQALQGAEARKKSSEEHILIDDLDAAYAALSAARSKGGAVRRVDFVLDNAGFELFVDLVLAGYLLTSGLATEVVLHAKVMPWFVSDVVPKDFDELLNALADPARFYGTAENNTGPSKPLTADEEEVLKFLFDHWGGLKDTGRLELRANSFWTLPGSYWRMPGEAPMLFEELRRSELVVFKGDLNYRKLTGDAMWVPTTPFAEAIGPLGPGSGINVLALRTCKADVVVGLRGGEDERLRAMENGGGDSGSRKWAWSGKWAVVSFSKGREHE